MLESLDEHNHADFPCHLSWVRTLAPSNLHHMLLPKPTDLLSGTQVLCMVPGKGSYEGSWLQKNYQSANLVS